MILTLRATDQEGKSIPLINGSRVPDWGGPQAGQPGRAYAKVLEDIATGEAPVISYWKPTRIADDSRIAAMQTDVSQYHFATPLSSGWVGIQAELRYRRNFYKLMDDKNWMESDIILQQAQLKLWSSPRLSMPVIMR